MTEAIAEVFSALRTRKRVRTLEMLNKGYTIADIADEFDMSYAGVYGYYQDMEEALLVTDTEGIKELTEVGEMILDLQPEIEAKLREAQKERLRKKQEELQREQEQLRGFAFESDLSAEEIEEILEEVKKEK